MGLLKLFGDWNASRKQHDTDLDNFAQMLRAYAAQCWQTPGALNRLNQMAEEHEIARFAEEHRLKDSEIHPVQLEVYREVFNALITHDSLTEMERAQITGLARFLRVSESEAQTNSKILARMRLLTEISAGNLPSVHPENVLPQKGEEFYWREPAKLIENKVVSHEWVGHSSGFSFRVMKGVSYRTGVSHGHMVSHSADVIAASGDLFISNRRVVFAGDRKSVSKAYKQIISTTMFSNGIVFHVGTLKPFRVQYDRDVTDIIASIMTHAINSQ